MALGSNTGTAKIFLTVGFGKIRQKSLENKQKVDKDTPGAVKRLTQAGAESWALEHDFVSGTIENIFYKEDAQYGNSFEVVISDEVDTYQVSFPEESRFWVDFMKKLPNVDILDKIKITAYDFTNKEGKRNVGISLEQNGQKITSYYEQKLPDNSWKLLHGFPDGKGIDFKDKDEAKVYFIRVKKFLRAQFQELFADKFSTKKHEAHDEHESPINLAAPSSNEPEDIAQDLPF